jgi:redox-sensitive bicupin YhaK (pirin superfamily)
MITIRKNSERGKTVNDWLTSYHSLSFNKYYDPGNVNFGSMVVLNDDVVKPGKGFGSHSHENMEIVSYVLEGTLEHKDSTGKSEVLRAGEVGRMSAGTGIVHSEYNHSKSDSVHFLQVWFLPKQENMIPSHEQKNFTLDQRLNIWLPIASENIDLGGTLINSPASIYVCRLERGRALGFDISLGHGIYFFAAGGIVVLNGKILSQGDAAILSYEKHMDINATQDSEIVLFDMKV